MTDLTQAPRALQGIHKCVAMNERGGEPKGERLLVTGSQMREGGPLLSSSTI